MKLKWILMVIGLPVLLAGCGSKNSDGQFSGQPNAVAKVVQRDKRKSAQSSREAVELANRYAKATSQNIAQALSQSKMASVRAQIRNRNLALSGSVTAVGNGTFVMQTLGHQVLIKSTTDDSLRVHEQVVVYGSGLAELDRSQDHPGIRSTQLPTGSLEFVAQQLVVK